MESSRKIAERSLRDARSHFRYVRGMNPPPIQSGPFGTLFLIGGSDHLVEKFHSRKRFAVSGISAEAAAVGGAGVAVFAIVVEAQFGAATFQQPTPVEVGKAFGFRFWLGRARRHGIGIFVEGLLGFLGSEIFHPLGKRFGNQAFAFGDGGVAHFTVGFEIEVLASIDPCLFGGA